MKKVVGLVEKIKVIGNGKKTVVMAKFDTGARRNSIDKDIAKKLMLKPYKKASIKSALGKQFRGVVMVTFEIKGRKFVEKATVAERKNMAYPVLIGRNVIHGNFIIDTEKSNRSPDECDLTKN